MLFLYSKKRKGEKEMEKKKWNKCNACGVHTDTDEECCSACCSSLATQVELDKNEVKELVKAGKFYTKHKSEIEIWLSQ
jgi:hypothetical protein